MDIRLDCRILWLSCEDKVELDHRLKSRIESMMNNGLIDEAEAFLKELGDEGSDSGAVVHNKGVYQAIGFREMSPVIADRQNSLVREKCVENLVVKHRQYVKSQLKWIRNRILTRSVPVHKLDASDLSKWDETVAKQALEIAQLYIQGVPKEVIEASFPTSNNEGEMDEMRDTKTARTCSVCNDRVLVGKEQWEKHIEGRSHRRNVERQKKFDRKLREISLHQKSKRKTFQSQHASPSMHHGQHLKVKSTSVH